MSCIAITSSANQGFTEDVNQLWSLGCIYKPPAFINKVLLEHSRVHFLSIYDDFCNRRTNSVEEL